MVTILKLTFHTIILVDAINCYSCDINEKYNIDECNSFDDETPEDNCPDQNYCLTLSGKLDGETDIGYHSCGRDYNFGFKEGSSNTFQYFNNFVVILLLSSSGSSMKRQN